MNGAAYSACSSTYGDLTWAKQQCDKDKACRWLHDMDCDNKNWRFCSGVDIEDYKGSGGCSKIKTGYTGNLIMSYFITQVLN